MRYIRAVGVLLLVILAMAIPAAATGPSVNTHPGVQSVLTETSPVILPGSLQDQAVQGDPWRDPGGPHSNAIPYWTTGDRYGAEDQANRASEHPLLC